MKGGGNVNCGGQILWQTCTSSVALPRHGRLAREACTHAGRSYSTDESKSAARPSPQPKDPRQERQEVKSAKEKFQIIADADRGKIFLAVLARSMPRKKSSWREKKESISIAATITI
jgi:hypothetical protein